MLGIQRSRTSPHLLPTWSVLLRTQNQAKRLFILLIVPSFLKQIIYYKTLLFSIFFVHAIPGITLCCKDAAFYSVDFMRHFCSRTTAGLVITHHTSANWFYYFINNASHNSSGNKQNLIIISDETQVGVEKCLLKWHSWVKVKSGFYTSNAHVAVRKSHVTFVFILFKDRNYIKSLWLIATGL